jgi:hypothetical protein
MIKVQINTDECQNESSLNKGNRGTLLDNTERKSRAQDVKSSIEAKS